MIHVDRHKPARMSANVNKRARIAQRAFRKAATTGQALAVDDGAILVSPLRESEGERSVVGGKIAANDLRNRKAAVRFELTCAES